MSAEDPLSLIPHRDPFLFIDRVVELSSDRVVATWRADPEAAFFAGHYPGNPVVPGVLICEAAFQAGALLAGRRLGEQGLAGRTPVLTRINDARFKHVVRPGEALNLEVTLNDVLEDAYFMTGRVTVDDHPVVRVEFVVKVLDDAGGR